MGGVLDVNFNGNKNGMVATQQIMQNPMCIAQAMAIQPDQKILAAGRAGDLFAPYSFALARYNPDGTPDQNFGQGGVQAINFGNGTDDWGYAVAIQPDGRIIMSGFSNIIGGNSFALARFDSQGTLDPSFGHQHQGTVTTNFGIGFDIAYGVAVQPNGKIVAAGTISRQNGTTAIGLARYESDGSPDAGFGKNGLVVTNVGLYGCAYGIVISPDGRIVVAGTARLAGVWQFLLVRYNTDGSMDQNFGAGRGWVTTEFFGGNVAEAFCVAMYSAPDERIVAGGYAIYPYGPSWFALARYFPDGSLDQGFGNEGKVLTPIRVRAEANALAVQGDGMIVAAGQSVPFPQKGAPLYDFALARYRVDGSLDPNFGAGGTVTTTMLDGMGNPTLASEATGVGIQADGKVVAVGWLENWVFDDFALARYL